MACNNVLLQMNAGKKKSMRIIKSVMFAAIAAGCLLPMHAGEKSANRYINANLAMQAEDAILAPNVFTPNGDGDNDVFEVKSSEDNTVSLKIYTRAGVLIFSIEAKLCRWDGCSLTGQQMATGVYYYTAEVRGSTPKVTKCGFVHLFR